MTLATMIARTAIAALLVLAVSTAAQAGKVQVSFDQPERFADIGPERDSVLQVIAHQLQALGHSGLPAAQTLQVVITDIDLAGEIRLAGRFPDVRVLGRAVDWPRIDLQFTLSEGGLVLAQGSEQLADLAYLSHRPRQRYGDRLPDEQRLLSDWFARRFGPPAMSR